MTTRATSLRLVVAGGLLAVAGRAASEFPPVVEGHREHVFPRLAVFLQAVSGYTVVTLGEVAAILLIVGTLALLTVRRRRAVGGLAVGLGAGVLTFYAAWGLAYRYPPLASRLAPVSQLSAADEKARFIELAESSARLVNRAASQTPGFDGEPPDVLRRINAGLDEGFARLPASIESTRVSGIRFGPVKFSRVSFALSRLLISGYYLPWTGEAQINSEMTRTQWPRVAAHERAHQRGFARENEATVIGVIACLFSRDPAVFYSGALGLFVSFDRELAKGDDAVRRRIWAALPPRAVEDFRKEAAFWKAHEGAAAVVSEKVNDTYLKAQGVKGGVKSYGETTRLLLQAVETGGLPLSDLLRTEPATNAK